MSRLTRVLTRSMKEMKGLKLSTFEKLQDKIDNNGVISFFRDWSMSIRAFFHNLPMFIRFAWGYRAWDYTYNLEIFIKLLETTGKNLREHGNAINSEKYSRRAYTAAGLLRKAYIDYTISKTSSYIYEKYGYSFMDNYKKPETPILERRIKMMQDIADKKEDDDSKKRKEEAWKYVHKYIEHFWD